MPIDDFIELLNDEIDGKIRSATLGFSQTGRIVLGGTAGPDGGSGIPPGGFIGQLSQKYVTYDETELAASGGASSLVSNLNHIRYNIEENTDNITVLSGFVGENTADILALSGAIFQTYRKITSAETLGTTDYQIECTEGPYVVTLPTPSGISGRKYSVKNTSTGVITLSGIGNETIDGETTQDITKWDNIIVLSTSLSWIII